MTQPQKRGRDDSKAAARSSRVMKSRELVFDWVVVLA